MSMEPTKIWLPSLLAAIAFRAVLPGEGDPAVDLLRKMIPKSPRDKAEIRPLRIPVMADDPHAGAVNDLNILHFEVHS